jgi:cysteine desulfurase / selenocysteine lyase
MRRSTQRVRRDFPIFDQRVNGKRLVFLDSAASSQKPLQVLDAMDQLYRTTYANVHRGVYAFSERSTELYNQARAQIAQFIGAPSAEQIVFTRNATEALNLIAYAYGRTFLQAGDVIVLTELEHHANLAPWQVLAKERGLTLKFIPLTPDGTLDLGALDALLTPRVKLVSFAHVSNVLGAITDPRPIVARARSRGEGNYGRLPVGAAHADRCCRARLRFPGLLGPQDARADRYRRALRETRPAQRHATVPDRRRHDQQRLVRGRDLERRAAKV